MITSKVGALTERRVISAHYGSKRKTSYPVFLFGTVKSAKRRKRIDFAKGQL